MASGIADHLHSSIKSERRPLYYVDLNDDNLFTFEVLNSMCLLENYDHLLFTLECQAVSSGKFVVPPYDVLLVLMTLVTVSDHYKEPIIRSNDPYNTSRGKLSSRALKILQFYVQILQKNDQDGIKRSDIELLRCQFFLIVDSLSTNARWARLHRRKRRKTANGVIYNFEVAEEDTAESASVVINPYPYISCLEQKKRILGNDLLNVKLKQPGSFINMILWTLSNSSQEDEALYVDCHEIWMPLLELIVDLFVLRHDFFIKNELTVARESKDDEYVVQILSESPLANFLHLIDSSQSGISFCQCIFLSCDYKYDDLDTNIEIHPVYYGENTFSKTFVPRMYFSEIYRMKRSMSLRRKIIGVYCKLLTEVPAGHRLVKPKPNADELIEGLSESLAKFRNIKEFEAFFLTGDLSSSSYFVPLLSEDTLSRLFSNFMMSFEDSRKKTVSLTLVENLDNIEKFLRECTSFFDRGFFAFSEGPSSDEDLNNIRKADICILALFQHIKYLEGANVITENPYYARFIKAVSQSDSRRKAFSPGNLSTPSPSQLQPLLSKLLKS